MLHVYFVSALSPRLQHPAQDRRIELTTHGYVSAAGAITSSLESNAPGMLTD